MKLNLRNIILVKLINLFPSILIIYLSFRNRYRTTLPHKLPFRNVPFKVKVYMYMIPLIHT